MFCREQKKNQIKIHLRKNAGKTKENMLQKFLGKREIIIMKF